MSASDVIAAMFVGGFVGVVVTLLVFSLNRGRR